MLGEMARYICRGRVTNLIQPQNVYDVNTSYHRLTHKTGRSRLYMLSIVLFESHNNEFLTGLVSIIAHVINCVL